MVEYLYLTSIMTAHIPGAKQYFADTFGNILIIF